MAALRALSRRSRSGLATAFFSLISLSFGLTGAAQLVHAAQLYRRERQDFARLTEAYAADAASTLTVARLLVSRGDGPFVGEIEDGGVRYRVVADREDFKRAWRHRQGAQALLDAERARGSDTTCLFATLSPVAGGAVAGPRATPSELASEGEIDWRPGQRWRVAVVDDDGVAHERWYLLSGRADQPALEIMRARHLVDPRVWSQCEEGDDGAT